MAKEDTEDLIIFLRPYSQEVVDIVMRLRDFVWELYPQSNELIYDNYNAVAFGWSLTEKLGHTFCSVAALEKYAHFGFYYGSELDDPKHLLSGKGNQYRYIIVSDFRDFPMDEVRELLKNAYDVSMSKVKDKDKIVHGLTIVKSISPNKKRPGDIPARKKKKP